MTRLQWITCGFLLISCSVSALEDDKMERLRALISLNMEELGEVRVKLDDVFDVFDGLIKLGKVKVASGLEQNIETAPAVTTLITSQDIEATGARTLDEALNMVPGLHVGRRGAGYGYIYTMRGIHTNPSPEILVLLNGIPTKKPDDGRTEINKLPASMIQRIEVIRGPGSALYGADAFAGVINVITKVAKDIQGTEIGTRIGSFASVDGWIAHGKQYGAVDLAAILEWNQSDGSNSLVEEDAQTLLDHKFGTHASLAPGPLNTQYNKLQLHLDASLGKHWRWRGNLQQNRDIGVGLGYAQALDPKAKPDGSGFNTDLSYHNANFSRNFEVNFQLSYQFHEGSGEYILYPPGAFGGYFPEGFLWNAGLKSHQTRLEANTLYRGWADHTLRMGAGWQHSQLHDVTEQRNWGVDLASGMPYPLGHIVDFSKDTEAFLPSSTRRNLFVYVQDSWAISDAWELTVGGRYDNFSDFGNTTNPRLALVWKATPSLTSKLLYGRAFRAPTFTELHFNNPLLALGNSHLKPEIIDTLELAWDWRAATNLHLAANLFQYQIKDKIGFPGGQIQYANYGNWNGKGFELEARWKFSQYTALLCHYAYQNSKDEMDNPIADALQQSAYIRLDWMLHPNWFLDINTRWIADRPRAVNDWRSTMNDDIITDLTVRYKNLKSNWNFAVGVRNLFNEATYEPTTVNMGVTHDLPLTKRELFGEIRYKF